MQPWFDAHCHLDHPKLAAQRTEVLARAAAAGVGAILIPGMTAADAVVTPASHPAIRLYRAYGLHPYFAADHDTAALAWLEQQLQRHQQAPIGEFGLDFQCPDVARQQQQFLVQLDLALRYQRPMLLHHRQSQAAMLSHLRPLRARLPNPAGMLHAFSGSYEQAKQWLDLGFYLGVGGVITYPRAKKTRAAIARLPLSQLLLETDAPDMPLSGFQGQINEPARVALVAQHLADLTQVELTTVAEHTWRNAHHLIGAVPERRRNAVAIRSPANSAKANKN